MHDTANGNQHPRRQAIFGLGEGQSTTTAPLRSRSAFDLDLSPTNAIRDTSQEVSVWRATLDHLDAIRSASQPPPAATATSNHKAFDAPCEQAVREGHLVDYDVVRVRSDVRMNGVFLRKVKTSMRGP